MNTALTTSRSPYSYQERIRRYRGQRASYQGGPGGVLSPLTDTVRVLVPVEGHQWTLDWYDFPEEDFDPNLYTRKGIIGDLASIRKELSAIVERENGERGTFAIRRVRREQRADVFELLFKKPHVY